MRYSMIRATSLLLLILAVPLQAQTKVSYSSLRPTLNGFRFFPRGKASFHSSERVYRTAFDSASVQFINFEVDIDYPRTAAALTFDLECRYQGPGGHARTSLVVSQIDAGWENSKHSGGWGSIGGGYWRVGSYQVTCRDGPKVVASGAFMVTRDRHDIPAIRGMVTRVRVMESPRRLPPAAERVYAASFDSATARYISTEIQLDFPRTTAAIVFPIDCTYRFPTGETRNFRLEARVYADWKDSAHTGGWGNDVPGTWAKGTYEITCRHLDLLIVQRTFQIS